MKNKVCILLSTYNGEEFLELQLQSLLNQTYRNFDIFIRDDGSIDDTIRIIKNIMKRKKRYDINIYLLEGENIGIVKSFFYLLEIALENDYKYIFFSDQDDIWVRNKMTTYFEFIKSSNYDEPFLIHSDMKIIDKKNRIICNSFFRCAGLDSKKKSLNYLLMENNITGNTIMINRKLASLVKYHKNIIMHDWWLGLIASVFGKIIFLDNKLVKYRKHHNNYIGPKFIYSLDNVRKIFGYSFNNIFLQALAFKEIYYESIGTDKKIILDRFIDLQYSSFFRKMEIILKYKFFKQNFLKTVVSIWKI